LPLIEKRDGHNITKEEIWVNQPVTYISQFYNIEETKKVIEKTSDVPVEDVKFLQISNIAYYENENEYIKNPEFDLVYGGSFRAGKREKDLLNFYFATGGKVNIFGSITPKHFKKKINKYNKSQIPQFSKRVQYNKVIDEMQKGFATIIIGDDNYKKLDNIPMRVFEAFSHGNFVFIDEAYDTNRRIFKNLPESLRSLTYIKNGKEAIDRIKFIKENIKDCNKRLVDLQRKCLNIDTENTFIQNIKEIISV
jgi:hypothetical protein